MAETIAAPMVDQHKLVEFHPPYPAPWCTQYRRWMETRAPTPIVSSCVAGVSLAFAGIDWLRQQSLPRECGSLTGELQASAETRPSQYRSELHAGFWIVAGIIWAFIGVWELTLIPRYATYLVVSYRVMSVMSFAVAAGYLIQAPMAFYGSRYLKNLPTVSPMGYPPGWHRDMNGYLRWWDGYKWTLAFAPGEAERSRLGPPAIPQSAPQ